jgi:hypothetical protein
MVCEVKHILSHVLGWQQRMLEWHETEQRGETPAVPAPGLRWGDLKLFNEMIYQEHPVFNGSSPQSLD